MSNSLNCRLKKLVNQGLLTEKDLDRIIIIPEGATRKDLHVEVFGIDPPELDSPYCECRHHNGGCDKCEHKGDLNCDVQWWGALYVKRKKELE